MRVESVEVGAKMRNDPRVMAPRKYAHLDFR